MPPPQDNCGTAELDMGDDSSSESGLLFILRRYQTLPDRDTGSPVLSLHARTLILAASGEDAGTLKRGLG